MEKLELVTESSRLHSVGPGEGLEANRQLAFPGVGPDLLGAASTVLIVEGTDNGIEGRQRAALVDRPDRLV